MLNLWPRQHTKWLNAFPPNYTHPFFSRTHRIFSIKHFCLHCMPNHLQCADGIIILFELGALPQHTTHTHTHIPFQFAQSKRKTTFSLAFSCDFSTESKECHERRKISQVKWNVRTHIQHTKIANNFFAT